MTNNIIQLEGQNVKITPYSMEIAPDITFEEWAQIGEKLEQINSGIQFYVGDWINYGSYKWEHGRYDEMMEHTGFTYGFLMNCASVTSRFPKSFREETSTRVEVLNFTQLRMLRTFPDAEVIQFLLRAQEGKWSTRRLEEAINQRHPGNLIDRFKGWLLQRDQFRGRPVIDRPIKGDGAYVLTGFKELPKLLDAPKES